MSGTSWIVAFQPSSVPFTNGVYVVPPAVSLTTDGTRNSRFDCGVAP